MYPMYIRIYSVNEYNSSLKLNSLKELINIYENINIINTSKFFWNIINKKKLKINKNI